MVSIDRDYILTNEIAVSVCTNVQQLCEWNKNHSNIFGDQDIFDQELKI